MVFNIYAARGYAESPVWKRLVFAALVTALCIFVNVFTDYGLVGYWNHAALTKMQGTGAAGWFGVIFIVIAVEGIAIWLVWKTKYTMGITFLGKRLAVVMVLFGLYNVIVYKPEDHVNKHMIIPVQPILKMYRSDAEAQTYAFEKLHFGSVSTG